MSLLEALVPPLLFKLGWGKKMSPKPCLYHWGCGPKIPQRSQILVDLGVFPGTRCPCWKPLSHHFFSSWVGVKNEPQTLFVHWGCVALHNGWVQGSYKEPKYLLIWVCSQMSDVLVGSPYPTTSFQVGSGQKMSSKPCLYHWGCVALHNGRIQRDP
jgi:hypothetical protein